MDWKSETDILRKNMPKHILFLCVANSARSQIAEGIARSLAPTIMKISSAGSKPSFVNPMAISVLEEIGINAKSQESKDIESIDLTTVDAVITLCGDEICPVFPGKAQKFHWEFADPAAVKNESERLTAFRQVRDELKKRLKHLFKGDDSR